MRTYRVKYWNKQGNIIISILFEKSEADVRQTISECFIDCDAIITIEWLLEVSL